VWVGPRVIWQAVHTSKVPLRANELTLRSRREVRISDGYSVDVQGRSGVENIRFPHPCRKASLPHRQDDGFRILKKDMMPIIKVAQ